MKKLYEVGKKYYLKYKEIVNYLICGVITTIINIVTYILLTRLIGLEEVLSSGLAWIITIISAYVLNRSFVFVSKEKGITNIIKEFSMFIICRIISGITCDIGTFALLVKVLRVHDLIAKVVTILMVVIVNYLFSKFLIFRKKDTL